MFYDPCILSLVKDITIINQVTHKDERRTRDLHIRSSLWSDWARPVWLYLQSWWVHWRDPGSCVRLWRSLSGAGSWLSGICHSNIEYQVDRHMRYSYNIESSCTRYVIIHYKVLTLNMKYWNSDYYMFNTIIEYYRSFFFLHGTLSYK